MVTKKQLVDACWQQKSRPSANGGFHMWRKTTFLILCLVMILGLAQPVMAVSSAGVLFLRIGAGVRAAGMGEAFVAVADDATATHWNPAGLGRYPLYDEWAEYYPPEGWGIDQAVAVKSISLGGERIAYDVWAISRGRLMRFVDGRWETDIPLPSDAAEVYKLAALETDLWAATDQGLFRNTALTWKPVVPPTDDGWEAESINDICVTAGPRIWLATDDGVKSYDGLEWVQYSIESGLPSPKILKVHFVNSRDGWAVSAAGLARFGGETFDEAEPVRALIGDTIPKLAARFIGTRDEIRIARAVEEIRQFNGLDSNELTPGAEVRIPYRLAFESEITCLTTDVTGRLWVGTRQGLKSFAGSRWRSFGYHAYTVEEPTPLSAIAEVYLGRRGTPSRIKAFTRWTARYNGLSPDETVKAGRTIYLYSGPAGASIRSLLAPGRKVYAGSKYGFLVYGDGHWDRMYQAGLNRIDGLGMSPAGRDLWFFAAGRMVSNKRAHSEASIMYVKWLPNLAEDIYFAYGTMTTHMGGWGTVGLNVKLLSYGEVARTDPSGPEVLGSFNPFDFSCGLSYGTRLANSLTTGLTAKVIYSRLSEQGAGQEKGSGTATAFGLDAGLLWRTPLRRLTIGVALTNLGPDITYIDADQSDPLPLNLAIGFAYDLIESQYNRFVLTAQINRDLAYRGGGKMENILYGIPPIGLARDLIEGRDFSLRPKEFNVGAEYWYAKLVALRAGYIYDEEGDIKTPTVGGGLALKGLGIDVAYIPSVRDDQVMANILRVSLTGRF